MSVDFAVVVGTFDEGRWTQLRDAIRSLRRQTLPPTEIVVVVDHNPSLLRRAIDELVDVLVVENHEARGLRGVRNSGLQAATASYVAFLDDDAQASDTWLELLSEPYEDPDVAGVGGSTIPLWEAERPSWFPAEFDWVVGCTYRGMPLVRHDVRNLWGGNMSFRRELVVAAGGFRIGYSCDDTELCIRLRQRWPAKRFVFAPEALVMHHVDESRTTLKRFVSRCYFEGGSKAVISRLVGAEDALASERSYVRAVLRPGMRSAITDFVSGHDRAGIARAGCIVAGLASAATGYGVGLAAPERAARKRGWNGRPIRAVTVTANGESEQDPWL
jgi:glycosyltransferase involved in cell wall biosynthesis